MSGGGWLRSRCCRASSALPRQEDRRLNSMRCWWCARLAALQFLSVSRISGSRQSAGGRDGPSRRPSVETLTCGFESLTQRIRLARRNRARLRHSWWKKEACGHISRVFRRSPARRRYVLRSRQACSKKRSAGPARSIGRASSRYAVGVCRTICARGHRRRAAQRALVTEGLTGSNQPGVEQIAMS